MGHLHRDPHLTPMVASQFPPPLPPSSDTSFPILAISIVGIMATAILLLSYYVVVIKCFFNWHRSNLLRRLSRSRRQWLNTDAHTLSSLYWSTVINQGLDESTIQAIPTLRFRGAAQQNSFHECAVCLNEFQEEEKIRMLPNCLHVFHIDCVDTWLQTHPNCPLCRSEITSTNPIPVMQPNRDQGEGVVIDVRDEGTEQTTRTEASISSNANPATTTNSCIGKERKIHKFSSFGDESIDLRGKDEQFDVQPMRRSFSMGSSSDRQLYIAVQEILRQNPHFRGVGNGEGTSSTGSGRTRRSFFPFGGHCRTSRNAVLPVQNWQ